jgi:simple sugar transport system permease protein
MRYANVMIGGLLAGLAGAYFTLESVPYFGPLMTNGKGFISLAAMIFGKWSPIGSWIAVLLFASAESLQVNMQILGINIPNQFVGMLPYLLTMIVLAGIVGRATPPAADGVPYEKQ